MLPDNIIVDQTIDERNFSQLDKIVIENTQYRSYNACKIHGYDDSFVCINNRFYCIDKILIDTKGLSYIVGIKLTTKMQHSNMYTYHKTEAHHLIKTDKFFRQCISITITLENEMIHFISVCKFNSQID